MLRLKIVLCVSILTLICLEGTFLKTFWNCMEEPRCRAKVSDRKLNGRWRANECRAMFEINAEKKGGVSPVTLPSQNAPRVFRGTEHYEDMGRLLPFHPHSVENSTLYKGSLWPALSQMKKLQLQITSTAGEVPYLPCHLQEYGPDLSHLCFKARLKQGKKLWILFAGDSKIRNTFFMFLNLTRSMEYNISYHNTSGSLDEVMNILEGEIRWTHFDAVSKVMPSLRVTMRFCTFIVDQFSTYDDQYDIQFLKRLAEGVEPVPDLLVAAYSTWTLGILDWGHIFPTLSALDLMLECAKRVAHLLHRISRRSRVLVLAESRMKPLAPHENHMRPAIFSDAHVELSEMMFFHALRQAEESRLLRARPSSPPADSDWLQADSEGLWWWDSVLPHSLAVRAICTEMHKHNLTLTPEYKQLNCRDTNHDSRATVRMAANMLLNLLCNSVVAMEVTNACCK